MGADSTGIINALTLRLRAQTEGLTAPDRKAQDTFMQIAQLNEQKRQRQAIQAAAREQHDIADAVRFHAVLEKTNQMRAEGAGFDSPDATEVPEDYRDYAHHFIKGQEGKRRQTKEQETARDAEQSQKDEAIAGEALKNWPKDQPMTAAAIRAKGFTPKVAGHALRLAGFENTVANQAGMNEDRDASRADTMTRFNTKFTASQERQTKRDAERDALAAQRKEVTAKGDVARAGTLLNTTIDNIMASVNDLDSEEHDNTIWVKDPQSGQVVGKSYINQAAHTLYQQKRQALLKERETYMDELKGLGTGGVQGPGASVPGTNDPANDPELARLKAAGDRAAFDAYARKMGYIK